MHKAFKRGISLLGLLAGPHLAIGPLWGITCRRTDETRAGEIATRVAGPTMTVHFSVNHLVSNGSSEQEAKPAILVCTHTR